MLGPGNCLAVPLQQLHIHLRTGILRGQIHLHLVEIVQVLHLLAVLVGPAEHEQLPVLHAHRSPNPKLQRKLVNTLTTMPVLGIYGVDVYVMLTVAGFGVEAFIVQ